MGNSKKTDIWTPEIQKQAEALRPRLDIGGDGGIRTHGLGLFLRIQIIINDQVMIFIKPYACYTPNGLLWQLATDFHIVSIV